VDIVINNAEKQKDNIYHLCSGNTLTLIELAQIIKEEYRLRYNISLPIITPQGIFKEIEPYIPVKKYTISNRKLKTIGFLPSYSISRGVNELFNYLETNYAKQQH
jgi:nucleoside-diphosphate-sugar epimerase